MRSGRNNLLKIAFALSSAVALRCAYAADSAPARAPEKIEFSTSSSTKPNVPRPSTKKDEMLKRFDNFEQVGPPSPGMGASPSPTPPQALPSRAVQEKMFHELDRKRNWAVPGAQDRENGDPIAKGEFNKEGWQNGEDKKQSVMERYLTGTDAKKQPFGEGRERRNDGGFDRREDRVDRKNLGFRDLDEKRDRDPRDPDDNPDGNGLAEFNLKNFIRAQNSNPSFLKDNDLPKASQLFRSDFGAMRDKTRDEKETERRKLEATRSAEFMQILRPNGGGRSGTLALDPINSPDQTRREMNPIMPRASEPSSRSPFGAPPSTGPRMPENTMFGVTGPAASSLAPAVNTPNIRSERPNVTKSIIHEPPKRPIY